jgi:hypothetical protein
MNVIFVDIDGALSSNRYENDRLFMEEKAAILKKMCDLYNAKVVISSSHKPFAVDDEEEGESPLILKIKDLLKRHNIELLGFTPQITVKPNLYSEISSWKDFEIIYYLMNHPEVEHFVILDDNDSYDLILLKQHLVEVGFFDERGKYHEGLQVGDIVRVGEKLKLDNPYRNLIAQEREHRVRRRKPRKE